MLTALATLTGGAPIAKGAPPESPPPENPTPTAPSSASDVPEPPAPDAEDLRAEAAAHYQKGLGLARKGAWDAALAEFLESRRLYPSRTATASAAASLRNLGRWDEALDMFEALLRDFDKTLPADTKAAAQREIIELRGLVGTIEIEGARPGAAISIDQRGRGEYPPIAPLRVVAGSHVVRVYKEGFEPFEQLVDVAGGKSVVIKAPLPALLRSGRLKVVEQGGREVDVIVDGGVVGKTPFEAPFAPGDHVIVLRGEGALGSPPTPISVELNGTTSLTLLAEELSAGVRIVPTPANALVAIDSVSVGRGIWEGRLRAGKHRIEMASPGFFTLVRDIVLEKDQQTNLSIALDRDPTSPFWREPSRPSLLTFEIGSAFAFSGSFDNAEATCIGGCSQAPGLGGFGVVRVGYELGMRLGFGVSAGYFEVTQATTARSLAIYPVGLGASHSGLSDQTTSISGLLAGGWAGFSLFERFPLRGRVTVGVLLGSAARTRSGTFSAGGGETYHVGPVSESHHASFFVISPELRVGWPIGRGFELSAGIETPSLIALARPKWDSTHKVYAGTVGDGTFLEEPLTVPIIALGAISLGIRYEY